jgi:hypothetical protein
MLYVALSLVFHIRSTHSSAFNAQKYAILNYGNRRAGERTCKVQPDHTKNPENAGGTLMMWPWRQKADLVRHRIVANPSITMLETAKEILAEVFHARPGEVDEMIQRRLEERSWTKENELWPATFCLGE